MNEPRLKPLSFPRGPVSRLTALAFGMGLALGAWASDPHGDAHEAPEAPAKTAKAPKGEGARAASKGEAAAEGKGEGRGKSEGKGEGKGTGLGELKASVSMSELRDLIDQKIAEVRAKQEPAPVVKVSAPRPRVKRAASGHGEGALAPRGAAPAGGHGAGAHAAGAEGHEVHWAYGGDTGPASWGLLKPEYQQCMLGKRQSPIDIRDGIKVDLEPIQFDYRATPFKVIDNGHTVQVNVEPGNSITAQGRRYDLIQFHFHRPSEERINGRQYEMVAHLVHKDVEGRLAVVAVLMDQGVAHPMVQQVWNNLPLEKNTEQYAPVMIDMNLMLPEQRQYYTYMGSLTTPPCSEGVLWMVMKQPATMSREQIGIFSRLYPMNARPIQSVSGRLIKDGQ